MRPSLRTITILMLLAGGSLGVFAGTLIADKPVLDTPSFDPQVDVELRYYQREFGLSEQESQAIRSILIQHKQETVGLLRKLHRENLDQFEALNDQAVQRMREAIGAERYDAALENRK